MSAKVSIEQIAPDRQYLQTCNGQNARIAAALNIALGWLLLHPEPEDRRHVTIETALSNAGYLVTASRDGRRIEARHVRRN